jgi:hypothetical protein
MLNIYMELYIVVKYFLPYWEKKKSNFSFFRLLTIVIQGQ